MGHVEVAHVSHVLADGRQLLDDASFKIPDGATAALVGPNGAGKTTLLRMLAGDLQPSDGKNPSSQTDSAYSPGVPLLSRSSQAVPGGTTVVYSDKWVTAIVITETRTVELRTLTPDQLIELAADEADA